MANEKNLLDFPTTASALSADWVHISQGGVDKKISLANFIAELNGGNPFNITVREESGNNRILTIADKNAYIRCLNATQTTIQVKNAQTVGWKKGDSIVFRKEGLGNVLMAADSGVTIRGAASGNSLTETGQAGQLICVDDTPTATIFDFVTGGNARATVTGSITFLTVDGMKAGATNDGLTVDFAELAANNSLVKTIYNNTVSKKGGAKYVIKTAAQASSDGDIVDGVGNVYVGGSVDYVAVLLHDGKVTLSQLGLTFSGTETAALQSAIDYACDNSNVSVLQGVPGENVTIGNIDVTNPTNLKFDFLATTFTLTGTASGTGIGFKLVGNCTGMKFYGATIVGDSVVANKHKGVYSDSGQTLEDIDISYNTISGVINGISMNSNLGGTLKNVNIHHNNVSDVLGTAIGEGYGIHWAYPSADRKAVHCYNNVINNVERHSIYCAVGGHSEIYENTITNHRQNVGDGTLRPAINILRGSNTKCYNNWLYDFYDGGVNISGEESSGANTENIELFNNQFINRRNGVQNITIGQAVWPQTLTKKIRCHHNYIYSDLSVASGGNTVTIYGGIDIEFVDNEIRYDNPSSGTLVGIRYGDNGITTDSDLDDVIIKRNKFIVTNGTYTTFKTITIFGPVCTNTSRHDIFDNYVKGPSANLYIEFQATQTNPNLRHDEWVNITFNDTWGNNSGTEPVSARIDSENVVRMRGRAAPFGSSSTTVGNLPPHCVPASRNMHVGAHENGGYEQLTINTSTGNLVVAGVPALWLSFEGVTFSRF